MSAANNFTVNPGKPAVFPLLGQKDFSVLYDLKSEIGDTVQTRMEGVTFELRVTNLGSGKLEGEILRIHSDEGGPLLTFGSLSRGGVVTFREENIFVIHKSVKD